MRLTFAQAYTNLENYAAPNRTEFIKALNEVCERYVSGGKWLGTVEVVAFESSQGRIALPRELSSVLAAQIGGRPTRVFGRFHEYILGGPGDFDPKLGAGLDMLVDEGDGFPTAKALEAPSFLEVATTEAADVYDSSFPDGGKIKITGYGEGSSPSGTPEIIEIELPLPSPSSPVVSSVVFTEVLTVDKPRTYGPVRLSGVVAAGATPVAGDPRTLLASYEPQETQPSYHRYKISSYDPEQGVRALCKRRFIPLEGEDDELIVPGNIGALKMGLLAVNYENKNDLERAVDFWTRGLGILNSEMRESRGGAMFRGQIDPSAFQSRRLRNIY
jgi:hypothetical protein